MTDRDARALRTLITKYGMASVVQELWRIARSYAESQPKWLPVRKAFGQAYLHLNTGL